VQADKATPIVRTAPAATRAAATSGHGEVKTSSATAAASMPRPAGTRVVVVVIDLGATPTMELAVVARRALAVLEERRLTVERVYLGTFLSALEMAGVSLSVLPVDDARLSWLDAPTDARDEVDALI
jgi:dihydroxyacetone kinase